VTVWNVNRSTDPYLRGELDGFLKGYYRDLMQSQPNHIEIIGEKNTVEGIIRPKAMEHCIPYTLGRGYCSLSPRKALVDRFRASGKEQLILLVVSDFDPEGEDIPHSFARSLRDDFRVESVKAVKVALTYQQVQSLNLVPEMTAKKRSSRYKRFARLYGDDTFELEAVDPRWLEETLADAINRIIDVDKFNAEIDREQEEARYLEGVRRVAYDALAGLNLKEN
jgi:hypothetical protein